MSVPKSFMMVVDIGTTNLKCQIFSDSVKLVYFTSMKMEIQACTEGFSEINPHSLWNSIVRIVDKCFEETHLGASDISCLGFSCHRCSFITWDSNTNLPFHNIITWKDMRASDEILKLNNSILIRILKLICYCLYIITGSPRFLAATFLKFTNSQITGRLLWMIKNNSALREAIKKKSAMFGTLDTWLLYRLTKGETYCTDVSSASATGMYDPFTSSWTPLIKLLGIPISILPTVCDSAGFHFGQVSSSIWGAKIPITCVMADQAAALYGAGCLKPGQVKITLGTGTFFDINVGCKPTASNSGFYPLVCWKYKEECVYALEAGCHDCGTIIDWLVSLGLCENVKYLSSMAKSVEETNGVYFIPASSDLQITSEGGRVASGFIGLKEKSGKEHLIRAVLESIVYQLYELYESYLSDGKLGSSSCIRINGGVSKNNFISQSLADICDKEVQRSLNSEMSTRGVALLASQVTGSCKLEYIDDVPYETFYPNDSNKETFRQKFQKWKTARNNFSKMYRQL